MRIIILKVLKSTILLDNSSFFYEKTMNLFVISGLSGSGKSVVLHFLEDNGFYAIDNLPASLLMQTTQILQQQNISNIAVAIDARSKESIKELPPILKNFRQVKFLFLTADDATLMKRFSELRRRHPLSTSQKTLSDAILEDRELTEPLQNLGLKLDTSNLKATVLRKWCREFLLLQKKGNIALLFQSFAYKHGIAQDADLVFDARCLPNPYYEKNLKHLTGKDWPVINFFQKQESVRLFCQSIATFLEKWIPFYTQDDRPYLTIAIGCTGGQHRSVFVAEHLKKHFQAHFDVLLRHRILDSHDDFLQSHVE